MTKQPLRWLCLEELNQQPPPSALTHPWPSTHKVPSSSHFGADQKTLLVAALPLLYTCPFVQGLWVADVGGVPLLRLDKEERRRASPRSHHRQHQLSASVCPKTSHYLGPLSWCDGAGRLQQEAEAFVLRMMLLLVAFGQQGQGRG